MNVVNVKKHVHLNIIGFPIAMIGTVSLRCYKTSDEVLKLAPKIRRCLKPHESNLKYFPVYTKTLCEIECRINEAIEKCNCIPFFYNVSKCLFLITIFVELKLVTSFYPLNLMDLFWSDGSIFFIIPHSYEIAIVSNCGKLDLVHTKA